MAMTSDVSSLMLLLMMWMPHLLLLLSALCESSDDARAALFRSGCVETLLGLLDGDAANESTPPGRRDPQP